MLSNFVFMMLFAVWWYVQYSHLFTSGIHEILSFSGFLYAFWLLAGKEYGLGEISKYMAGRLLYEN